MKRLVSKISNIEDYIQMYFILVRIEGNDPIVAI